MSLFPLISADPKICGGEPCLKGTRIPVHLILDHLAGGDSLEDILKAYPQLTKRAIQEAVRYASFRIQEELIPR